MWMQTPCTSERTGTEQRGILYRADIREIAGMLSERFAQKMDVVYLDPPALTRRMAYARECIGAQGYKGEAAFVRRMRQADNRFTGKQEAYRSFLQEAVALSKTLLKPTGCLYMHAPQGMTAEAKTICDAVMGKANCVNEIIWHYGGGGQARNGYARRHDTIYLYQKGPKRYFNAKAVGMPRGTEKRNNLKRNVDTDGRVYFSARVGGKEYRYYADALVPPDDVWMDISDLQHKDPERCGYDTQKPEALMARLLAASCPEDGWAADLFCGCGALPVAAAKQGKHFLAVDRSDWALWLTRKRLDEQQIGYRYERVGEPAQEPCPAAFRLQAGRAGYQVEICGFGKKREPLPQNRAAGPEQISWEQVWLQQAPVESVGMEAVETDMRWIDGVAVGYWEPMGMQVVDGASRTARHADIPEQYFLPYGEGTPCVRMTDTQGREGYFLWKTEKR